MRRSAMKVLVTGAWVYRAKHMIPSYVLDFTKGAAQGVMIIF
jgi:hypothetical protein